MPGELATIHVDIVVGDRGWIVERLAREVARLPADRFRVRVLDAPSGTADVTYFLPYARLAPVPGSSVGGWFTHQEAIEPARSNFVERALAADFCLTPADRYADLLREAGAKDVATVPHGVDTDAFRPKLTLGVVGRTYHTGRKGEALIAAIHDLEGLEIRYTGGGWPGAHDPQSEAGLARFYQEIDYLLIPALIEGGPVPLFEALASGCPVIASDVGCVPDFPHVPFEAGNAGDLRRVVNGLLDEASAGRQSVEALTWARFAAAHGEAFERAYAARGPNPARTEAEAPGEASVLLVTHGTEDRNLGGPTTRAGNTARVMAERGRDAVRMQARPGDLARALREGGDEARIVHVFNSWPLRTARDCVAEARAAAGPNARVAYSPIALNLAHRPVFEAALPRRLAGAQTPADVRAVAEQTRAATAPWRPGGEAPVEGYPGHFDALRRSVAGADVVLCLSEVERAFLGAIGADTEHARVVRNGVDTEVMTTASRTRFASAYGLDHYHLMVGRIEARKNQALTAAALADADRPLVLIGHAPNADYLALCQRLGRGNVVHVGRIDDRAMLASAYAGATSVLLPSWAEGAPLAALEAAATGAPLVLSVMAAEEEYLGGHADYVHPADLGAIAAAAERHAARPQDEAEAERTSRAAAAGRYGLDAHVEATLAAYEAALDAPPRRMRGRDASSGPRRFVLDVTHSAHQAANGQQRSGVTTVEREVAAAMLRAAPGTPAVAWNSPTRAYVPVRLREDGTLPDEQAGLATAPPPLPGAAVHLRAVVPDDPADRRERPAAPPPGPLTVARGAISVAKEGLNALPAPLRRRTVGAIRRARPAFNPAVLPEHRVLTRAGGVGTPSARALPAPPGAADTGAFGLSFETVFSSRTDIPGDTLLVTGQPWISNDRQLEDMIDYAGAAGLGLWALVHDALYVTDRRAFEPGQRRDFERRLLRLMGACERVLVTAPGTERTLRRLADAHGARVPEIGIVPLGLPRRPDGEGAACPVDGPFALYVSSINDRKEHDFLVEAWRSAGRDRAAARAPMRLVLAGRAQRGFERYREPGFLRGLAEDGIVVIDQPDDAALDALYRTCAFTVYPSRSEGWGFPPLESLAYGKACLATDGLPSLGTGGLGAGGADLGGVLRLPASDIFAWRAALLAFRTQDGTRDAFAERARRYEPPSWNATIDALTATA